MNGKAYKNNAGDSRLCFNAFTKENFSDMTEEEKDAGPMPKFTTSTFQAGKVAQGTTVHAEFSFVNDGKEPMCVYKVDADAKSWSHSDIPCCKPGQRVRFRVHVDTAGMPKGEMLLTFALRTMILPSPIFRHAPSPLSGKANYKYSKFPAYMEMARILIFHDRPPQQTAAI